MSPNSTDTVAQHLVLYFKHGIQDIIPYSDFIQAIRPILERANLGEYLGDDMAIDGGDAEGIFAGPDARELHKFLLPEFAKLDFLRGGKVTLVFGPIDGEGEREEHVI
jgi:hypothetical protein